MSGPKLIYIGIVILFTCIVIFRAIMLDDTPKTED
jgi:hypothetical protein